MGKSRCQQQRVKVNLMKDDTAADKVRGELAVTATEGGWVGSLMSAMVVVCGDVR